MGALSSDEVHYDDWDADLVVDYGIELNLDDFNKILQHLST